ncbi:hypothetical protein XSR1_310030 [Xenorhabdus szentirmaii DSM 16338]|uniref:Uncharacterized protein n=1 Tax=Xenorhabdus szentirmaii DSM 16338 TaxID=1427518 RepID=W1J217_9GAMM|nr:hypothetical protein XSR1_310030 [Xenorhabdus szentirmaii DSM 16338]
MASHAPALSLSVLPMLQGMNEKRLSLAKASLWLGKFVP